MTDKGRLDQIPWVVCGPAGVYWLGHAKDEHQAWTIALGWPDDEDIRAHKDRGWYAATATVTWSAPNVSLVKEQT